MPRIGTVRVSLKNKAFDDPPYFAKLTIRILMFRQIDVSCLSSPFCQNTKLTTCTLPI